MIRLRNIERCYPLAKGRFFYVLRDVNIDIEEGEFVSIMGPSGAGKSSLLHILGMHDHGWTGEFYLNDVAVHHLRRKNARHCGTNRSVSFFSNIICLMT